MPEDDKKPEIPWWQPAIVIFSRLSGWIIGPIIISIFLGKWLDRRYGTEPWLFLSSVGIAFAISISGIVRDARKEIKKIEEEKSDKRSE